MSSDLIDEIQRRGELYELHCRVRKLATDEELAAFRPGGKENDAGGDWEYGRWLFNLGRFFEREQSDKDDPSREAEALEALRAGPAAVKLVSPPGDSDDDAVWVYPKSFHALLVLHGCDWTISWLLERLRKIKLQATADDAVLLGRVLEEISYQYGIAVWAATTEGPGLPWEGRKPPEQLPPWIDGLDPIDVRRINAVFWRVNAARLLAVSANLDELQDKDEAAGGRPGWSIFMGTLSMETGIAPSVLMRDHSLAELLLSVRTANIGRKPRKKAAEDGGMSLAMSGGTADEPATAQFQAGE